jgi:hypothetical protein
MSKERDKMEKKDCERISAVCPCRVPPLMVVHHRVRYKVEGRRGRGGMGNSLCVCVCNCVCVIVVMCLPLCETCQRVCGVMRVESERRPAALPPPVVAIIGPLSFAPATSTMCTYTMSIAVNEETWPLLYTLSYSTLARKRVNSNEIKRDNLNPSTLEQVSFRSFILFSDENNKRFPMLCVFDWLCNVITSVTTSVLHHNPTK